MFEIQTSVLNQGSASSWMLLPDCTAREPVLFEYLTESESGTFFVMSGNLTL